MKNKHPRDPRFEYEAKISHDVFIPDILYDGRILNLSSGGIYFESDEPIEPGDEISITVKKIDGTETTFDVEITRREQIYRGDYQFGYGAKVVEPAKTIVKIVDNDEAPKRKNRRQHTRHDHNRIVRFRHGGEILRVWIKDISAGGAFIQTGMTLPVGKRLILNMGGEKTGYITRKGRIVRIDATGFAIKFDRRQLSFKKPNKKEE